jgi:hypothetical protein
MAGDMGQIGQGGGGGAAPWSSPFGNPGPYGGQIGGQMGGPFGGPSSYGASSAPAYGGGSAPAPVVGAGGLGMGLGGLPDGDLEDFANEPPLLEELGVSFAHMQAKLSAVMLVHRPVARDILLDSDMAGPLVLCLALGFFLLLRGKLFLGYIYGFGLMGCVALWSLLSLMQPSNKELAAPLDLARTFSALGYSLLPIVALSALNVLVAISSFGYLGFALGAVGVLWATWAATRIFEAGCAMAEQRWLIAFPIFLFFTCFALIAIF